SLHAVWACGTNRTILAEVDGEAPALDGSGQSADGKGDALPLVQGGSCVRGQACAGQAATCSTRCGSGALETRDCYCDDQHQIYFCDDQYCPVSECPALLAVDGMVCEPAQTGLLCTSRVNGGFICRCALGTWQCSPTF